MICWYDIPYDMIYDTYNNIDMWCMIYDNILYNKWYRSMIYVWNDMQLHIWYDKQRYMICNIEVWYTDMIYHTLRHNIYNIQ